MRRDVYGEELREWRRAGWIQGGQRLKVEVLAKQDAEQAETPRPCSGASGRPPAAEAEDRREERNGHGGMDADVVEEHGRTMQASATTEEPEQHDSLRQCSGRQCSGHSGTDARAGERQQRRGTQHNTAQEESDEREAPPRRDTTAQASHCRGATATPHGKAVDTGGACGERRVIHQYSDGAWEEPEEGQAPEPAGYGVVEFEREERTQSNEERSAPSLGEDTGVRHHARTHQRGVHRYDLRQVGGEGSRQWATS